MTSVVVQSGTVLVLVFPTKSFLHANNVPEEYGDDIHRRKNGRGVELGDVVESAGDAPNAKEREGIKVHDVHPEAKRRDWSGWMMSCVEVQRGLPEDAVALNAHIHHLTTVAKGSEKGWPPRKSITDWKFEMS